MKTKYKKIERIKESWDNIISHISQEAQERIIRRVTLEEWGFNKAVRNEGLMCMWGITDNTMRELFKKGVLTSIKDRTVRQVSESLSKSEEVEEEGVVYEKKADSFIPRPKNR